MTRIVVNFLGRAALYDLTRIHNVNAVRISRDDAEVMRNDDHRHTHFSSEVLHQLQNLRLNCNIECCRWLIRNNELRIARQSHRNHHALPHPPLKW